VDAATLVTFNTGQFNDYNNIQGLVTVGTDTNFYSLADATAAYPASFGAHNMNADPQFLNAAKQSFALQPTSPHIQHASDGSNIGGTQVAQGFYADDANSIWNPANGAALDNLQFENGTDLVIGNAKSYGSITSAPLYLGALGQTFYGFHYIGLQLFNKSQAGGSDTNQQVPDSAMYAGNDASGNGNPDRLQYQLRFSQNIAQPQTDADWDNAGLMPAGSWGDFEFDQQPLIDGNGVTNAGAQFDQSSRHNIGGYWVQIKIVLRNDYQ
jgi:hypothetical protein